MCVTPLLRRIVAVVVVAVVRFIVVYVRAQQNKVKISPRSELKKSFLPQL